MHVQEHSTVREGLIAGLLGAVLVATWYFVFDAAAGRPFHTPNVLGKVFFRGDLDPGRAADRARCGGRAIPLLHLVMFAVVGNGADAAGAPRVAEPLAPDGALDGAGGRVLLRDRGDVTRLTYSHGSPGAALVGDRWLAGGVAGMGWYLLSRHPRIRSEVPLGDEVTATHHSPGPPRGGSV